MHYYETHFLTNLNSQTKNNEENEIFEKIGELYEQFKDVELEI